MEVRRTNNTEVDKTPYDIVVFKNGSALMEAEMNEAQDIMMHKLSQIHNIIGDCITGFTHVQKNNGSYTLPDRVVAMYGKYIINMSDITFNVADGIDTIYLHIEDIMYTVDSEITAHGAVNNVAGSIIQDPTTVENKILDDRIKKETSYRSGFRWWLSEISGGNSIAIFKIVNNVLSAHSNICSVSTNIVSSISSISNAVAGMNTSLNSMNTAISNTNAEVLALKNLSVMGKVS